VKRPAQETSRDPIEPRDDRFAAGDLSDLAKGAIHCWHFDIDRDIGEPKGLEHALSPEERSRAARISNPVARGRFVGFRGLLRATLARYLDTAPESIRLTTEPHGKPQLEGSDGLHGLVFNASHSGTLGALALAFDGHLGIDIERWRALRDPAALAARCLAPSEQTHWLTIDESGRESEFFRLWTLKEAFGKAVGRGLAIGVNRCVFDCRGERPRLVSYPIEEGGDGAWDFSELEVPPRTSGAIAFSRPIETLRQFAHPPFDSR
jgi:4'-phosphopantetheinyl transferase